MLLDSTLKNSIAIGKAQLGDQTLFPSISNSPLNHVDTASLDAWLSSKKKAIGKNPFIACKLEEEEESKEENNAENEDLGSVLLFTFRNCLRNRVSKHASSERGIFHFVNTLLFSVYIYINFNIEYFNVRF